MSKSAVQQQKDIYSDFGINLNVHPLRKDINRITNEDAVRRSIKNILLTNHYERKMRPTFGANLSKYLFELITPITLQNIKIEIESAISNYEPRCNIISTVVSAGTDNNSVEITVTFSLLNSLNPVTVSTILGRVK